MSKLKREALAHYLDSSSTGTPAYILLGVDLEELNVEMNANVNSIKNILGYTSKSIDSYEPQASVDSYYADSSDSIFTRLQAIIDGKKTLDDLKTTAVEVHLWEGVEGSAGTYVAYREDAIIEIVSYGGDSAGYRINYNYHYTGNRVKGTFAVISKTFTPDAA